MTLLQIRIFCLSFEYLLIALKRGKKCSRISKITNEYETNTAKLVVMNDFYARDGSRRVTTGYRQKQKAGLVITPPFGYFKDKNTNQVEIVPEAAETIHLIFASYVGGMGVKAIARMLNEEKRKTPAQM